MLDTQLTDGVARSTFQSFLLAMAIIFLLRLVQFRDFYLGLLSLLPNAFPIWSTFGVMGLLGIPLNVSTAMSATVVLGIADDETIHFFASYQALRRRGQTPRQAILETLTDKGSSIFFSTLIITLGFSTLFFSNYGPTMWFGLLLSDLLSGQHLRQRGVCPGAPRSDTARRRSAGAPGVGAAVRGPGLIPRAEGRQRELSPRGVEGLAGELPTGSRSCGVPASPTSSSSAATCPRVSAVRTSATALRTPVPSSPRMPEATKTS